ncbi:hypothetical protein NLJ89_g3139 [Agrocybe chaxingu]|uniref:UBX domain-containing protein n=1 Tax=Agrocybe chaxingu TaxID=84603 RepID=A0A9W8K5F6_9AGAR|nr:hypothetical protein NLJ89_g3139 [Agrocybe chaxingu]
MSSDSQRSSSATPKPPAEPPLPTDFKIYRAPNRSQLQLGSLPPLSDDYFKPTTADLQAAQATLSARTQALVNAPLQLRKDREAELQAKRDRWPETRIRIKFTDGTQLEKSFPSTSKIRVVYAFVRSCLREDTKPIKFVLYQPPKYELRVSDPKVRDQSLSALQLAPSSVLLLRFEDDRLNHVNVPAPLDTAVLSQAIDLPPPPALVEDAPTKPAPSSKPSPGTSKGEIKVPKWLKLGKK